MGKDLEISYEEEQAVLELGDALYGLAEQFDLGDDWAASKIEEIKKEVAKKSRKPAVLEV